MNETSKDEKNEDLNNKLHDSMASFIYQRKNDFKGSLTVLDFLKTNDTLGYSLDLHKDPEPILEANIVNSSPSDLQKLRDLEAEN